MTQETKTAEATPVVAQAIPEPKAPEVKEPTIEELKASLAQYEKDLKSAREEAKAHQKFGQEKQTELKNQSDLRAEIASIRDDLELAVTAFATRQEENTDGETVKGALAELAKKRDAREASRKTQEAGNILSAYQQRVTALGLTEEDQDYWEIYRTARTLDPVDLKLADLKLKKLEVAKAQIAKVELPKESEETRIERLVKEKIEAKYPGIYASDANAPGGGVSGEGIPTDMVSFRKWLNDMPQEEYEKKYASKVSEMMRSGKIK